LRSPQAEEDWQRFVGDLDREGRHLLRQDRLNSFLIGLHLRGERLFAHDLKDLLDETPLGEDDRLALTAFIEPALSLLVAYDHARGGAAVMAADPDGHDMDDDDMDDGLVLDEDDLPPGTIVI
jgi:hypothetical protein